MSRSDAQEREMAGGTAARLHPLRASRTASLWPLGSPIARKIVLINLAVMSAMVILAYLLIAPPQGKEAQSLAEVLAATLEGSARPEAGLSSQTAGDLRVYFFDDGAQLHTSVDKQEQLARAAGQEATRLGKGYYDAKRAMAAYPVQWNGSRGAVIVVSEAAPGGWVPMIVLVIFGVLLAILGSIAAAATISKPLQTLVKAAEGGQASASGQSTASKVLIPDLTGRSDEFGRLSGALRDMVTALYSRIDANEQFAADVSHELKNPLASLRSAVGTMRLARREDQRAQLLAVIDHDVQRLDRLVTDISNASRLDSELVKEQEAVFDLRKTLMELAEYLGGQAKANGVAFVTDFPAGPVPIMGLEPRLAQVFVNLITNALSFSEEGDAIRLWLRKHNDRVVIAVEDTGPGIPESALERIFQRFYSQRPDAEFGEHSGLGLAISRQIVEAHGGVIWAENIHPTDADPQSEPMGARFVVALPL